MSLRRAVSPLLCRRRPRGVSLPGARAEAPAPAPRPRGRVAREQPGVALLEQFRFADAVGAFGRALEKDPSLLAARINLAIAHLYVPDIPAAKQAAEEALKAAPRRAPAELPPRPHRAQRGTRRGRGALRPQGAREGPEGPRRERDPGPGVPADAAVRGGGRRLPPGARGRALQRERRLQPRRGPHPCRASARRARRRWRASRSCATARTRARSARTTSSRGSTPKRSPRRGRSPRRWTRRRPRCRSPRRTRRFPARRRSSSRTSTATGRSTWSRRGGRAPRACGASGAASPTSRRRPASPGWPRSVAVAGDYDNDGLPDLLVLGAGRRVALPQRGRRALQGPRRRPLPAWPHPAATAAFVDIDHDGDLDVFVAAAAAGRAPASCSQNNGDRTFADITATAQLGGAGRGGRRRPDRLRQPPGRRPVRAEARPPGALQEHAGRQLQGPGGRAGPRRPGPFRERGGRRREQGRLHRLLPGRGRARPRSP